MKRTVLIICLIWSHAFSQKMYCTKDSIPVYKDKDVNSGIIGYIHKNDQVSSLKKTKYLGSITYEDQRLTEIFLWGQVKTSDLSGWTKAGSFVKNVYSKPNYNLWNFDTYDNADKVYNIGWSKDGKYYAYIVSGYIDGGLDGLTVRFYVINTKSNNIEKEIVSYTSYDMPIDDAWRDDYSSIQSALNDYNIIQDTSQTKMNPVPVKTDKNVPISLEFELSDTLTNVNVSFVNSKTQIMEVKEYIVSIYSMGWMKCPYVKDKYIVFTTSNRGSSEYFVQAFAVDLKMLRR